MGYDFILFDADGTLFDFNRSERYSFTKLTENFGFDFSEEIYADYHVINDRLWKDHENGLVTKPFLLVERYRRLFEKYRIDVSPEEANLFYLAALGSCRFLTEGALEICAYLSSFKPLYIVTNGEASVQNSRYSSSELRPYFSDIFISGSVGVSKPSKEYFDYVEAHIDGFDRKRAIIIGDSLTSDIRGGNNAGIDACWFNPDGAVNDRGVHCEYEIRKLSELKKIIIGE